LGVLSLNRKKLLFPLVLLLVGCLLAAVSCAGNGGSGGGAAVEIELIDLDGNSQTVDLASLEQVTGEGGFVKSTGTVVGPAELTGPKLLDILDKIGGITAEDAVQITAQDGYEMTLTYDQCNGNVMTYDPDGEPLQVGGVEAIVALESTSEELLDKGPRIAFIKDKDTLCDGHFWIKEVAVIKVVPAVAEWELSLSGIEEATIDRSTFESIATCGRSTHPGQEYVTTAKDSSEVTYFGVPLWVLVSMIDGADDAHYRFNRELSKKGYTVQVIAADGYTVELKSEEVAYVDGVFLAYLKNEEPLDEDSGPVQLVGPDLPSKQHSVKQVAEIKLVDIPE